MCLPGIWITQGREAVGTKCLFGPPWVGFGINARWGRWHPTMAEKHIGSRHSHEKGQACGILSPPRMRVERSRRCSKASKAKIRTTRPERLPFAASRSMSCEGDLSRCYALWLISAVRRLCIHSCGHGGAHHGEKRIGSAIVAKDGKLVGHLHRHRCLPGARAGAGRPARRRIERRSLSREFPLADSTMASWCAGRCIAATAPPMLTSSLDAQGHVTIVAERHFYSRRCIGARTRSGLTSPVSLIRR